MEHAWFKDELETANLGDQRLNQRLANILEAFAARPNGSIPLAVGGRNELEAAYRFFNNDKVTPEKILQPHYNATKKRCEPHKIVLCPQDTSELDFTRPQQQVAGAGPLDGSKRRGAFLHLIEAFTEDGTPLGALGAKIWTREEPDPEQPKPSRTEKAKKRRSLPIEKKESIRWLEGFRITQKVAETCSETTFVSLCDSEGDMYELLVEPRKPENFHWIIRACHNRVALDNQGDSRVSLRDALQEQPVLFMNEVPVRDREQLTSCEIRSRRKTRSSRLATVEVRAGAVMIQAPAIYKGTVRSVSVNVVWVLEPNPPEGEEAIEWILLTTLPISSVDEVLSVIRYYTVRWMIEIFFRTLKSGCRIEARRFETYDRMIACMAIYVIVAWRTLFVCRLGRSCPEMSCDVVFDSSEWKSVWSVTHRGQSLPSRPPPLSEVVRLIGRLGGFVDRPNSLEYPGVETVWQGLQRMRDLAWGWETYGPGAPPP